MLLGLEGGGFGGCFAEMEELADLSAEFGEVAVLLRRQVRVGSHETIVSRYILV